MIPTVWISRVHRITPLFVTLLLSGCSGDRLPLQPSSGGSTAESAIEVGAAAEFPTGQQGGRGVSLENLWPNDDGHLWVYDIEQHTWDPPAVHFYGNPADVPPAPSLAVVAELLRRHPTGRNQVTETASYRMQFQGLRTTLSGVTGQNLVSSIARPPSVQAPEPTEALASNESETASQPGGFMVALRTARPDLVPRIAASMRMGQEALPARAQAVMAPTFLFGYVWERTRQYIGSYGDLNTSLAWKYLVADLRPGSTFHMQLVPDLADDVFLHARVLREGMAFSSAGSIRSAIEVLYLVDFGVSSFTDADGNILGHTRMYSYGTVTYAPRIGPVASYERGLVQAGRTLDPGIYEQVIHLTATSKGPPPG